MGLVYLYEHHVPRTYQTSALLYVQDPGNSTQPGGTDVQTSQALIPTYSQIFVSPAITSAVDATLAKTYRGYRIEAHDLKVQGVTTTPSAPLNTQLMSVSVTDTIPQRAAVAANTAARAFIRKITAIEKQRFKGGARAVEQQLAVENNNIQLVSREITNYKGSGAGLNNLKAELNANQTIYATLLTSSQDFNLARSTAASAVKLISPAPVPTAVVGPHPIRISALAGFIALILGLGLLFLYDYFDDTPRTPEQIEALLGAPILGTVQQFDRKRYETELITARRARSPVSEAYRVIRTNIRFTDIDHPPRTLVITSASPAEGKSTTAANLANVFAEDDKRVTLIDADLRRPSLHRIFQAERGEGLTNMLTSTEALNGHHGTKQGDRSNLELIASGPLPPRPATLLGSDRMRELTQHFANDAQILLIDSPPVLAVADAAILSTVADGVLMVVDPAKSKKRDLRRAREAIEAVGGRIIGIVINRLNKRGSSYYYYYYHHNYGYQYNYQYLAQKDKVTALEADENSGEMSVPALSGDSRIDPKDSL